MKLTSQAIKNKEFRKGVRGYIPEEVDDFMSMIAKDYEALTAELESLSIKVSDLEERVTRYSKMESALQTTLVLAQDAAAQLKEKANSESERIITEANQAVAAARDEAAQIVETAQAEGERLVREAREAAEAAHSEAERIISEAQAAVQDARQEAEELLLKASSESDAIIDKAKKDVLFVIDEFDLTKKEYTGFRSKFKEFMKLQMENFDEMDREFVKHYEELRNKPPEAGMAAEERDSGDIEEAESFEDVKSFFESEISDSSKEKRQVDAGNFDDITNFFGEEKPIEEYKRTNNS
jgi:DivIVA domain-containing protein